MNAYSPLHPTLPTNSAKALHWCGLSGSALALAVARAVQAEQQFIVVIAEDNYHAHNLEQELAFYLTTETLTEQINILSFPDWETLPYDVFSPHHDIISARLHTLYHLPRQTRGILVLPITTLMQRLPPMHYIQANSLIVQIGDRFDVDSMRQQLQQNGYRAVSQVIEHGEYAVRGALFDLFPMGAATPYRLELDDDVIDTIRCFDPETQRTTDIIERIELIPGREFPLSDTAIARFRQQWRAQFEGNPLNAPIYEDISQGLCPAGIEYYLPLFFEETVSLFHYFPANTILVIAENCHARSEAHWREISHRYDERCHDRQRPILKPATVFLPTTEIFENFQHFRRILHFEKNTELSSACDFQCVAPPNLNVEAKSSDPLMALRHHSEHRRVLLCAESLGRKEILSQLLTQAHLTAVNVNSFAEFLDSPAPLAITIGAIDRGLVIKDPALSIVTENQLFGGQVLQRRRRKDKTTDPQAVIRNLAELAEGSPVVHLEHGVGRYLGLHTLDIGGQIAEFLTIEYGGGDKLYVPVASLHLISRYTSQSEHAPLHKLGSDVWEKAKRRAVEKVRDVAAELLELYAKRAARTGIAFKMPDEEYALFVSQFQFEETPDQAQAIQNVIDDLCAATPMDRLVCGDVGFGKTEVAIRAAFLAIHSGKQVAILVPTTLLAQQHYQTFSDRFAEWPIKVEMLSRFRSHEQQKEIIAQLAQHKVDIIIGTHKLISENIKFADLGLVIIDEEHRFGVRQKERLKALRAEVEILTLTATPIPRTLNMAMSGMRELSIIATPPAKRLSIKTFVHDNDPSLVREAILRELQRGGQVYFIHNKVETIEKCALTLMNLVPEARIEFAHGQMAERELERKMADFYHQRFNVLVCTTIIETGIDIPTANTIILDHADHFGLAQLHQLRGRVGRSHHQAYAYLLVPNRKLITPDAEKRLTAIAALEDLGAGFTLATHDLEIRGAGELLGEEQSGHIQEIGFSLYMELLEKAISSLKRGQLPTVEESFSTQAVIDLQISALIPESYLADPHQRLVLYKRIASCENDAALDELKIEMIDRFGLFVEPIHNLFAVTQLKLIAAEMGIKKIEANAKGGMIEFTAKPKINPAVIIELIQKMPKQYQLNGQSKLRFVCTTETGVERKIFVEKLLEKLRIKE